MQNGEQRPKKDNKETGKDMNMLRWNLLKIVYVKKNVYKLTKQWIVWKRRRYLVTESKMISQRKINFKKEEKE